MSNPEPSLRADQTADTPNAVPVFALWLLAQLVMLLFAWADLPLIARSTSGCRALADQMMILTQIGISSLIATMLTRTWRSSALAAAIAFPFMAGAATIADVGAVAGLRHFGLLLVWLAALTFAIAFARRIRVTPAVLTGLLAIWVWGALIAYYLLADFRPDSPVRPWLARLCPLLWPW